MKLPRDLSGADLVAVLCKHYGYSKVGQVGSHAILQVDTPIHHRIAIPLHDSLRVGTLNSIIRAVAEAHGLNKQDIVRRL